MKKLIATCVLSMALVSGSAQAANVLVYGSDFDGSSTTASPVVAAWNGGAVALASGSVGGASGNIWRNDGPGVTTLTLSNLPTHSSISLSGLLAFIDSWDGNTTYGPDHLTISLDGVNLVTFTPDHWGSGQGLNGLSASMGHLGFSAWVDSVVNLGQLSSMTVAHSGSSAQFGFLFHGAGAQYGADESFGLDKVAVTLSGVSAVPEPATWGMMIGGFGLVGGAMRSARRKQKVSVSFA